MTDDGSRCKNCHIGRRRLGWKRILLKNKFLLVFAAVLCLYAIFPGPFIPGQAPGFYTVTVIAAVLITAPIFLIMFFWSMTPPTSDARRGRD
ncbi:MAG: hypothetical protein EB829_02925 [Nitrosopumilus sp. H8]|nr:MAG: hypothetical protein EB830_02415 [Nitrosopumilus sp. H13]RNJ79145.1 MAG: hypothetical protein EB829_02925 [Nitrosopumilus sp. H8]